jgi:RES domain-containing protein
VRVVYTAGSLALACLELLVNIDYEGALEEYVAISVEFDESLVLRAARDSLPIDWQSSTTLPRTRAIGDTWVERGSSAILEVPSRVVPEEANYLLDPNHPGFATVRIGEPRTFRFDPDHVKVPNQP